MRTRPYVSFVVSARNDNYGGDFLGRMQVFVGALLVQCGRQNLDAELVIVEWNPPEDRPRLREAIRWPDCPMTGRVQIVEVPRERHEQLPNSKKMPIFEYMAKNVGIRRATGEYVLATNPDILFSDSLIRYLAAVNLNRDTFYRANRYDVALKIPVQLDPERQLELCARHAFCVQRMHGTVPLRWVPRFRQYLVRNQHLLSPRWMVGELLRRARQGLGVDRSPRAPLVHLNASGDFLLMSATHWQALRGYPELATHSHIDSYLVYMAAIAGLRQTILPWAIYHQEHDRSEQACRPLTNLNEIPALRWMLENRQVKLTNGENWGLGDLELKVAHPQETC